MIQINPLKSYIDGGVRAALTTPPSASLVFDLPGKAIWVKGVKLKGTDHTYTFSHDNYITLTNTPDSNESEDIKIGVNTSALKNAIDTTYGVVSTTANGLAPKFTSGNKLAASAATTYYFLGWTGSTLKWYQAPFRNIRINSETTDCLGVNNTDPLIISSGNGISVTWDSTNKKIIITNTKPDVNHNTDTKVALSATTLNKNYAVILKGNDFDEGSITTVNFSTYLKFNPSTKLLTINGSKVITTIDTFVGATTSADGSVGLVTKPLIANRLLFLRGDGTWATPTNTWRPVKVEGTEKLGSNALDLSAGNGISIIYNNDTKKIIITNTKPDVNHNTHYTTMLYIGENNDTKANKNVANPYLKLFDDNARRATFQIKAGSGIAVASDVNGNITITNSSPDVNHNTDRTGIKLATVSGTKKTDSTLILTNSTTGLNIQGGTNKFLIGDGTNYIEVPVTPFFTVSNKDATIGTALTTLATIAGVDIKAKIASYSLSNHTHSVKINGSTKIIAASGAVDLGNYLPLSGGTMSGTAWIVWPDSGNWGNNNSSITFPVIRGGLQWGGQSDYVKLFSEETSSDNLNLVLQFGDDNSNGLSIRNTSNVQTSYISAGGIITTKTFKGNLDWSYITNKPSSYTPSAHTHAWNSLTHSSTTENQAILTNGSANGWKLYTLNISGWNNAANNAHSHSNKSVLDGITSTLVGNWDTAYNFVNTISGTDTDKVINKWDEIVNFLAGISEDDKLNTLLNNKLSILLLSAKDILTTKTNNALFWVDTKGNASTITTGPFTDHPYALLSVTNYNLNAENHKFFYRSRLAFSSAGDIKVASCHHENEYQLNETWYNVLTSKNSGINGSTIKLNGTSITVYSSSTSDSRFVKKTGDTMSGALNFANNTWNRIGDDSYIGDCNTVGMIGIKAANTTYPGIAFFNNENTRLGNLTVYNNNIKYRTYSLQFLDNGNTSVSASTWMNPFSTYNTSAIANGQAICVWGQSSYLSNLASDSGDMSLWLKRINANAATLNMVLDGEYYANGNLRLAHVSEIPTSLKNPYSLTLKANGTILATYDGSSVKEVNFTYTNIGAASASHNHDDRYVRAFGTSNDNIDSDWGLSFKTFDPIPSGTPPELNLNISLLSIGNSFNRRKLLAFTYNNDNIYYRRHLNDGFTNWVKLLHTGNSSISGSTITLNGSSITVSKSDHTHPYLPLSGGKLTGSLEINATGGSLNEGIRMHTASNGWCGVIMCGSDNKGSSGTSINTWGIHNHNGLFYINRNASDATTAYILCNVNGNWGMGTNSPFYKLHTIGDIYSSTYIRAASGFIKGNSSDNYVLLGGGGHKLISDFSTSAQGVGTIISISKSLTPTTSWIDTGIKTDSATFPGGNGSYIVQISIPSSSGTDGWGDLYTGYFSLFTGTNSSTEDEILLHGASHALLKRIYLKTKATANTDGTMHFYIASEKAFSAARTINFKFRKLI